MALRWSSLVECMERVPCWPCTNSTYVCSYYCYVCDSAYSKMFSLFDAVGAVCNFTSCAIAFAFRMRRNLNNEYCNGLALIFVGRMYGTGAVLALCVQTESTFVAIAAGAIQLTRRCFCCSMPYWPYIILPHVLLSFICAYAATLLIKMGLH